MDKIIHESGANFGPFKDKDLFHIEKSTTYNILGKGVKTVEFICARDDRKSFVLVEAKKTCPNERNREESPTKIEKYDDYYASIVQKVEDSLQILVATLLERFKFDEGVGENLRKIRIANADFKFVLVLTSLDVKEDWLAGPKAELERRLLRLRKIWGLKVIVMNQEMAKRLRLVC